MTDPFDNLVLRSIARAASDVIDDLDAREPEPGDLVAHYRIVERLGAGGMGVVFKAEDTRLERFVALKFLHPFAASHAAARSQLAREARAASALSHSGICTVYDVVLDAEPAFIVMAFLEGETLRERLARGTLPEAAALEIAEAVAAALAAAHGRDLVHCDIKPANVFLTSDGETKLLDFGIARLDRGPREPSGLDAVAVGSRDFMSPEQARGEPLDHRSDIYSLGAMLRAMVASPGARLVRAIEKMTAPTPAGRFQSMADVIRTLAGIRRHGRAARWPLAAAVAAVIVAVSLTVAWRYSSRPAPLTARDLILIGDFVNRTGQPVFDDVLRDAVEVKLGQSPALTVFPATRIAEMLKLMRRKPGDRLTAETAREICERAAIKVFTVGSIAKVGARYVVQLDAIDSRTGSYLARQQSEASSEDGVLAAIDRTATATRRQLGESLPSLHRFDVPIATATTGSMEALRLFRQGQQAAAGGTAASMRAAGFFKRALAIDPDFALAYVALGVAYRNVRQFGPADEAMRQAFARRDRASPRERLAIETSYYGQVSGEVSKAIETMRAWADAYPEDAHPHNSLMAYYKDVGQLELAAEEGERAVAMVPSALYRANLAGAYVRLHQYDRARAVADEAVRAGADNATTHRMLDTVARLVHDGALAAKEQAWMSRRTQDFAYISGEANLAGSEGRLRDARRLFVEALALTAQAGLDDRLEQSHVRLALIEAYVGNGRRAATLAHEVLGAHPSELVAADAAFALTLAGDRGGPGEMASLAKRLPTHEFIMRVWQPLVSGLTAQASGDLPRAIQSWRLMDAYDRGDNAWLRPSYHLGIAHLAAGDFDAARARFEKVIEYQGVHFNRPLFALAHLGLARVDAAQGRTPAARTAYEKFFEVWKTADADLPVMRAARREYAHLHAAS